MNRCYKCFITDLWQNNENQKTGLNGHQLSVTECHADAAFMSCVMWLDGKIPMFKTCEHLCHHDLLCKQPFLYRVGHVKIIILWNSKFYWTKVRWPVGWILKQYSVPIVPNMPLNCVWSSKYTPNWNRLWMNLLKRRRSLVLQQNAHETQEKTWQAAA